MEQELEADICFVTFLQALVTAFLLSYSLFAFCFVWGFVFVCLFFICPPAYVKLS